MKPKIIDLFCGAGGLSRGFEMAGFDIVAGIDIESNFAETFNKNHRNPVFYAGDVSKGIIDGVKGKRVDIIIGSPPCQGFSDARGCRVERDSRQKKRNFLPFNYLSYVDHFSPKIAIMENVSGMGTFKINGRLIVDVLVDEFKKRGYKAIFEKLNSGNYGVPQERIRIFGLAIKDEYDVYPVMNKCDLNSRFRRPENFNTVGMAISDLGKPSDDGISSYKHESRNVYQKIMRKDNNFGVVHNHKVINSPNKDELILINRLPEGRIFRSSRFGNRYMGVWELYSDVLKTDEIQLLHFLCRKRTHLDYKEQKEGYQEGYIRPKNFPVDSDGRFFWEEQYQIQGQNSNREPIQILESLYERKWLRKKEYNRNNEEYIAYDINTKSGIRPMYMRLHRNKPSRTILTTSFRVRELVHPTENRAITLREGARIQSFPDDFIFYGLEKKHINTMIGNAVPPLMGYEIARYIKMLLKIMNHSEDKETMIHFNKIQDTRNPINTNSYLVNKIRIKEKSLFDFIQNAKE